MELNEIVGQRTAKIAALKAQGEAVYPSKVPEHICVAEALAEFAENKKVTLCGRITAKRLHGKALFMDLRDATGKLQVYAKADFLGEDKFARLQDLDIADIIVASGELFKTHTGEPTIKAEAFQLLAKALRPLPEKWHGLKDVEKRYRQRYLDLLANEDSKKVFQLRSQVIKAIRDFLDQRSFQEVETPMLQPIPGGAAGRPFQTFHNEYKMNLYLRIAPELYLKRLLVGGLERVYELNRSFRNEGVSTRHNPEFTMFEVYVAYADYEEMMRLSEELLTALTQQVLGRQELTYQGKTISLSRPWQRYSFSSLVKEKFGIEPADDTALITKKLKDKGLLKEAVGLSRSQVNKLIEDILAQEIGSNPVFVTDYFSGLCPLAKARQDNPLISERFELYIGGLEIGNAYSELNDPQEQRRRFAEELKLLNKEEQKALDEDYCLALEHGMPPAAGLGIGVDRIVMLLADQPSIRDVILFPLLREE